MSPSRGWTADSHWGHRNILTLPPGRPFTTIEEHDQVLIENWNRVVSPGDQVMHLGDVSLSVPVMERVVAQLNGDITLIPGNHDACWTATPSVSGARRAPRMVARYLAAGFVDVWGSGQGRTQLAGLEVAV
jgi:predicted phosphohydrolase